MPVPAAYRITPPPGSTSSLPQVGSNPKASVGDAFSEPDQACSEPSSSECDFLAILEDKNKWYFDFSASAKILIMQLEDTADSTIKDEERQALEATLAECIVCAFRAQRRHSSLGFDIACV